ncbi:MAG TPA: COX15/CtaA family protein [Pseudonocardiaceae bacterium]
MVVAQAGISVTGSVVRVTGSGLGCPEWPQCFPGSLTPVEHPEYAMLNQWVEFGNRLLINVIGLIALACLVSALLVRPRRKRLVWLAAAMPLGVAAQAVIGGVTVRLELAWWTVAIHFLASMVLVWLATLLVGAVGEGDAPPRDRLGTAARRLMPAMVAVLAALLVAGTLVTGAGPHAGDPDTPRLDLPVPELARVHSGLLFGYLALLVALGLLLRRDRAQPVLWRRYRVLLVVVAAQGTLGYVQYWTGVPGALVAAHVLGAASVVIATAALWTATRDRGPAAVPSPVDREPVTA